MYPTSPRLTHALCFVADFGFIHCYPVWPLIKQLYDFAFALPCGDRFRCGSCVPLLHPVPFPSRNLNGMKACNSVYSVPLLARAAVSAQIARSKSCVAAPSSPPSSKSCLRVGEMLHLSHWIRSLAQRLRSSDLLPNRQNSLKMSLWKTIDRKRMRTLKFRWFGANILFASV